MDWLQLIQEAINYMEEHLLEDINYEDVSRQIGMSSYNFHRTFSLMANMTANAYIRNRRLSLAGQDLQMTDISVLDAALKYGYETPESFSKAFSRFHGVTPKQAKMKGSRLCLFQPLMIKVVLEGGTIMDYRIERREQQKFLTKVRSFRNETINSESNHSISEFWSECYEKNYIDSLKALRPLNRQNLYGLCSSTEREASTFDYGIGIRLDEDTDQTKLTWFYEEGFEVWEVEPTDFAVFKCIGKDSSCVSQMWNRFYKEFLPQTSYEPVDTTDYEVYMENSANGLFCELWIPVTLNKDVKL